MTKILLQGKNYSQVGYKNIFLKIKICATVLFQKICFPPYWEIRSDQELDPEPDTELDLESDPDPKFPEKSDLDPKKVISEPQHCFFSILNVRFQRCQNAFLHSF